MGGSSKKVTVGYKYYAGIHMILCHGTADKLVRIRVDERDVFLDTSTGGSIYINKPNIFGGESREGGVQGTIDFEPGEATQGVNSYLSSKLGSLVPAFRGVVGIVMRQMYMGLNPYLKKWDFRVQRIHKRFDDQVQWYDAKAEIDSVPTNELVNARDNFDYQIVSNTFPGAIPTSGYSVGDGAFGRVAPAQPFTPPVAIGTTWPINQAIWLRKTVTTNGKFKVKIVGQYENSCRVYWDGELVGTFNGDNDDITGLPSFEVILSEAKASAGSHTLHIHAMDDFEDYGSSDSTYIYANVYYVSYGTMNPAHIIRECLTDPDWGMGYQDADIDDTSFTAAADTLYDEKLGMCIMWERQNPIEDFIEEIKRHVNAEVFVDRTTGKFVMKLIRDDYDEGSLITLDKTNVEKVTEFKRPTFGELNNAVTVNFWDIQLGETSTITVQDIALAQQQGNTIQTTVQYRGFVSSQIATRVAQRDLTVLSTPLISCTLYANRIAEDFNLGSVFKFDWPEYGVEGVVMRVTGINYGDGKKNRIRINCVQDVFSLPNESFIPDVPPEWEDPTQEPTPVTAQIAFEVPYFELVQQQSQTAVDDLIASNPQLGYLGVAAARPASSALNARLFTDSGPGYEEVGLVDFCPSAILAEDISEVQETFEISDANELENVEMGTWFQLGTELLAIVSIVGTTATVQRGVLDTVPVAHTTGEVLYFWDAYAEGDPTEYVETDSIDVKLATVTGGGQLELADAPSSTVVMDTRAYRPYPPGNFKINDNYFPTELSGAVALSWASRNRLQQTTLSLIDFFDGSITSEAGVTYTVRLLTAGGSLVSEETGITDLTTSVTVPTSGNYRLQLFSVRDGYDSYQIYDHAFTYSAALQRISFPLTYDEDDADGTFTLTRQGPAPWLTTEGMKGDGVNARYRAEAADLPTWVKTGGIGPLTLHASVNVMGGARNATRDVIITASDDDATANPKLELAVVDDVVGDRAVAALRSYTGSIQTKRLFRDSWKYQTRFPVLDDSGNKARPQAVLFIDSSTVLISAHYENTLSRVYRIDLTDMSVTGTFDFPSPYVHVGSAAYRASDGTYWFGDYDTGTLLQVDLATSFTNGTAEITLTYDASTIFGFAAVEWIDDSGTEYLLAAEYGTSGTRYVYVIPKAEITDGGSFAIADRLKRFETGAIRMQGVCFESGKMFVSMNEFTADATPTGKIARYDIITAIASTADGATLTPEWVWHGPSEYVEDIDFHPTTGEIWTSSEGYDSVGSDDGWLAYWSGTLTDEEDGDFIENHVTAEYDGDATVTVKINNQLFEELAWSPTVTPAVVSIGGPPAASAGQQNGFFVGTVRNIVLQDQAMTDTQYADAIDGSADEPNTLTEYTITLTNAGAEAGDASGWTVETGVLDVRASNPDPHNGSWYFFAGNQASMIVRQRFDIATETGLTTGEIDTLATSGDIWARVDWWQTGYSSGSDAGGAGIRTLDGVPSEIDVQYSDIIDIEPAFVDWYLRGFVKDVDNGSRNIDVLLRGTRFSGTNNDAYFDDITFKVYTRE